MRANSPPEEARVPVSFRIARQDFAPPFDVVLSNDCDKPARLADGQQVSALMIVVPAFAGTTMDCLKD